MITSVASVFGVHKRLEPMPAETKAKWQKEIDWLLSVTDHIVELVPSKQRSKDGSYIEIMVTRQRNCLRMNIPTLRRLDAMLLDCLDSFKDQNEFYYTSKIDQEYKEGEANKWWSPAPQLPPNGLGENTRKWLQYHKDSVIQVLKKAMAINTQVLAQMEIPEIYIDSLPKNARARLGDTIYKSITDDFFDPDLLLSALDLSSNHKILDLKNRIEASMVIWKRKINATDTKYIWGSASSLEKREVVEKRAETILQLLRRRFPGVPHSDLDICKIQSNRDVGHAILESYSRIIEGLACTVLSRIECVIRADSLARTQPTSVEKRHLTKEQSHGNQGSQKWPDTKEPKRLSSSGSRTSRTLQALMGWNLDHLGK